MQYRFLWSRVVTRVGTDDLSQAWLKPAVRLLAFWGGRRVKRAATSVTYQRRYSSLIPANSVPYLSFTLYSPPSLFVVSFSRTCWDSLIISCPASPQISPPEHTPQRNSEPQRWRKRFQLSRHFPAQKFPLQSIPLRW